MSILQELSAYASFRTSCFMTGGPYESLLESIEELFERAEQEPEKARLQDPTKKLTMSRVHTVMLSPSDKGFGLKDKVFGIRNEDPIVDFMLDIMGVPRDGTAIRIRSGFMQYDSRSKMLFIGRYKSDLPGEQRN
jgi:hypothetical protein